MGGSFSLAGRQSVRCFHAQCFGLELFSNFGTNSAQICFGRLQTHLAKSQTLAGFNVFGNGNAFARRVEANDVAHAHIHTQTTGSANGTLAG